MFIWEGRLAPTFEHYICYRLVNDCRFGSTPCRPQVSDRAAAVLVGLFEDSTGVVRVLLTQRSSRLKSHRGEVGGAGRGAAAATAAVEPLHGSALSGLWHTPKLLSTHRDCAWLCAARLCPAAIRCAVSPGCTAP